MAKFLTRYIVYLHIWTICNTQFGGYTTMVFDPSIYNRVFVPLQIFWFTMIVNLLVKVLILREELSDIRDIKEDEDKVGGKGLKGHSGNENGTIETKKKQ